LGVNFAFFVGLFVFLFPLFRDGELLFLLEEVKISGQSQSAEWDSSVFSVQILGSFGGDHNYGGWVEASFELSFFI